MMGERPESDSRSYESWLDAKRNLETPALAPRVLQAIQQGEQQASQRQFLLLLWRLKQPVLGSLACLAAFTVGSAPFVYLAYVARLFAY